MVNLRKTYDYIIYIQALTNKVGNVKHFLLQINWYIIVHNFDHFLPQWGNNLVLILLEVVEIVQLEIEKF